MRRGAAGIAGAAFVLAAVLLAAPLYVSSVSSAALQRQFDERCPNRIGLVLPESSPAGAAAVLRVAQGPLAGARNLAQPVRTSFTGPPLVVDGLPVGVDDRARLLHRPGAFGEVEVLEGPNGAGVLVPDGWAAAAQIGVGDEVALAVPIGGGGDVSTGATEPPPTETVELRVAGVYRDIAGLLPPVAWCLQSGILAPNSNGDPPPPLLLLDDATFEDLPPRAARLLSAQDVVAVERSGLTIGTATDLSARFDVAIDAAVRTRLGAAGPVSGQIQAASELPAVVTRAQGITELVRANVRPVQAAGVLAAVILGLAAGLLTSRRRQAELTTRAVRGEGPARLAARVARAAVAPATAGATAGGLAALLAVRTIGPSPDLGPVVGRLGSWALVAALATVAATSAAAAPVVARLVDAAPRRRRHRWLRVVPWEWALLPVVVIAGRRLDDVGGAQFLGNETTGVDALAMAFPMLAATAGAVCLVRPVVAVARRFRRAAPRADPGLVLGMRRLAHDPVAAAAVAGAVALAVATAALGGALSESAQRALDAKARTFVGAESSVAIAGRDRTLPASLVDRATVVHEARAMSGARRVVVLGVTPASFADGVSISAEQQAAVGELDRRRPTDDGGVAAIVVGPLPDGVLELDAGGRQLAVDPISRPETFPTSRLSSTLVVVDLSALEAVDARTRAFVLSDLPAASSQDELLAAGRRVTGAVSVDEVITGTSNAAVEWAYAGLRALGVVVVTVLLGVQLARSAAKLRQRQLAEVFTASMGMGERRAVLAEAVEHGAPLGLGLAVGLLVAFVVAGAAIADLDSARILPPRSSLVTPWWTLAAIVVVAGLAIVMVVVGGRRQARRSNAAVVLRAG